MASLASPTLVIGRRPLNDTGSCETSGTSRSICEGILQKRCRLSWRPRYVELHSDPTDFSGRQYSFQLMIFDPRRRMLKDKIRMEDIVTIRANQDCYFQIFLANGKILQLKADSIENEAYWIAMLKVGLGRGTIFHVRVNTPFSNLEHALLYSIGVKLPARRMGQLDRVLILTSPINDVNIHAWDLNRVKSFMELEVGIRMELCSKCQYNQPSIITLVMERQFIRDCISFLCRETRISQRPSDEKGIPTYNVNHKCGYLSPPPEPAPSPPDPTPSHPDPAPSPPESVPLHPDPAPSSSDPAPLPPNPAHPPPAYSETDPELSSKKDSETSPQPALQSSGDYVNVSDAITETEPTSEAKPPLLSPTVIPPSPANPPQPQASNSEANRPAFNFSEKDWDDTSDSGSHYLRNSSVSGDRNSTASDDEEASYPPRNIPRKNYDCSIPAVAQPYLNFQPYLFSSSSTLFEAPYQISSRIIISDSGEVQYERNILGNMPMAHGGFHFKKQVPLPPRRSQMAGSPSSNENLRPSSPKPQPRQPFSPNPDSQAFPNVDSMPEPPIVLPTREKTQLFRTVSDQIPHLVGKIGNDVRRNSEDDIFVRRSTASSASSEPRNVISPSYVRESVFFGSNTATDKNDFSSEREATQPKDENEDYEDIVSVVISHRQKVESQVEVFPPPRPSVRPKPRPRTARSKTVNVTQTSSNASNDDSSPANAHMYNGEYSGGSNLDGSSLPSEKVLTRGNDQAGLLDHEDWNGGHLDWTSGRITTATLVARKPHRRPPIPTPRIRTPTTMPGPADVRVSTSNGRDFESERKPSESAADIGESDML